MAGAGYKLFNTGDVLTAAQVNTYLQEQVVMVFADATARTTALSGVLAEGMVSYLKDTDALEIYSGTAWVGYGSGDITGVTAGTGISGGGTSGTVTITNSMATEITAAGDIIVGTGSGTFDNLPIGTTGQVLTADTTVSPYKVKWATAAAGGGDLVRITTSTFSAVSAANVDSVFSSTYQNYLILMAINSSSGSNAMNLRFRTSGTTNTTTNYGSNWEYGAFGSGGATGQLGSAAGSDLAYISDVTGGGVYYAMTVFNPQVSQRTLAVYSGVQTNSYRVTGALQFAATTSFDGISFISAAGTITGNISVYGYKNSQE